MLYVLILYCSGLCPSSRSAPDGVLLFTSLQDCKTALAATASITKAKIFDANGKQMRHTFQKQTCAHMYADPKQLDRLYHLPLPQK